jgi:hypothetical protein
MVFPIGAKADYTEILDPPCKMEANQLTEMPKHGEIVPVHFTNGYAMNSIWRKRTSIASGALAALIMAGSACAQYVWIGENGVKQYSDVPPPSSVPQSRILKGPGKAGASSLPAAPAETAPAEQKSPMTTAQRNAEFQKRRIEQAEKEKKAAEKEKLAADKARNCEQARSYSRTLESGGRVMRMDQNGERSYLTDDQRAQETAEAQRVLSQCS